MKKNQTKKNMLFRATMLLALLQGMSCFAQDDNSGITVGDVSNTGCAYRSRSESVVEHPFLKLTRNENGLYGELINYEVNCFYDDVKVNCQENEQELSILVDEGSGIYVAACNCPINIYFTIFNALKDEYHVKVRGVNVGTVSFKEHSVVIIDMSTLEQAYEEGFEYPVKVNKFWSYETTNNPGNYSGNDFSQSLEFHTYYLNRLSCNYKNYILPCEYNYLDVQAELDKDGTLVVNVLTDGIPDKDCNRVAQMNFDIINIQNESYHLRLNHTVKAGTKYESKVCLYEGDIKVPELYYSSSITINDKNDYNAIVNNINLQQVTGKDSHAPYYDLQGRRLKSQPQKGLYIRDGKKEIVR